MEKRLIDIKELSELFENQAQTIRNRMSSGVFLSEPSRSVERVRFDIRDVERCLGRLKAEYGSVDTEGSIGRYYLLRKEVVRRFPILPVSSGL